MSGTAGLQASEARPGQGADGASAADGTGPARGHLKVYLGFAAGVGKTYTMLEDAGHARAAGVDVVVGYVEPHARPETTALLQGLEVIPTREVERGGARFHELDLEAVLARRAGVVLVDELAHTNTPGSRHAKRYQDVQDILDAGSDVWSTLNVQHLESLNDQVAAITHVRQRETLPDAFLRQADAEIIVVDLSPEQLRERIRQGKVYPHSRIATALEGFFRAERLTGLRELALREMAQLVEGRRLESAGGRDSPLAPGLVAVANHLLILAAARPGDERIVRQGWRLARSLQCSAEVVHIAPEGSPADPAHLEELRRTCGALALPLRVAPARAGRHGIGEAVGDLARELRATHVLAGATRDRRLPWRGSTLQEIMDRVPWADFVVVGDPARWQPQGRRID